MNLQISSDGGTFTNIQLSNDPIKLQQQIVNQTFEIHQLKTERDNLKKQLEACSCTNSSKALKRTRSPENIDASFPSLQMNPEQFLESKSTPQPPPKKAKPTGNEPEYVSYDIVDGNLSKLVQLLTEHGATCPNCIYKPSTFNGADKWFEPYRLQAKIRRKNANIIIIYRAASAFFSDETNVPFFPENFELQIKFLTGQMKKTDLSIAQQKHLDQVLIGYYDCYKSAISQSDLFKSGTDLFFDNEKYLTIMYRKLNTQFSFRTEAGVQARTQEITIMDENNKRRFVCPIEGCSKSYASRWNLNWHVEKVHGDNPTRLSCQFCQKTYARPTNLKIHIDAVHFEEKRALEASGGCIMFENAEVDSPPEENNFDESLIDDQNIDLGQKLLALLNKTEA